MKFTALYTAMILILFQETGGDQHDVVLYERDGLRLADGRAMFKDRILYDAKADHAQLPADDPCSKLIRIIYTPLSLTGNCYAYEKAIIENGSLDCGTPASSAEIIVIDIQTGKAIDILQLVNETSLVNALKNDSWVKALNIPPEKLSASTTLGTLLGIVNQYSDDGAGHGFNRREFVFTSFDKKKNKVAVRLIRKEYSGFNHYQFLQLGLWVTPNTSFAKDLEMKSGFFLGKFKGGILIPNNAAAK